LRLNSTLALTFTLQYEAKEYLEILAELVNITKSRPDLVSAIGLCNFDSEHTKEVCEYLQEKLGRVGIVSNQIQVRYLFYGHYHATLMMIANANLTSSPYLILDHCKK
jgi:diketogulonate reductase-like aldo/keto reductase